MSTTMTMKPAEALKMLLEGNERFVSNQLTHASRIDDARRQELTEGQAPFASVLTCADSRTPPENIFDAGLGELFVCRNAGNVMTDAALGSFEYAAAHTGCPLLLVLGHTSCGAVGAAVGAAEDPSASESPYVDEIVRRVLPAVIASKRDGQERSAWVDAAAEQNVLDVCRHAVERSAILGKMVSDGVYRVVGGWYDLATGKVTLIKE